LGNWVRQDARYDAWAVGVPHANHDGEARLVAELRTIHTDSHGTDGSPRVHAQLRRRGWRVNRKRVERLLRVHGIVGHRPHRRRSLTKPDSAAVPAPDLLGRLFDPDRAGRGLVREVTWIPPTRAGCTWPACWTWPPGACSAGRWASTTTPPWSATPWTPRSPPAAAGGCPTRPTYHEGLAELATAPTADAALGVVLPVLGGGAETSAPAGRPDC
jgi:hypothetical protein